MAGPGTGTPPVSSKALTDTDLTWTIQVLSPSLPFDFHSRSGRRTHVVVPGTSSDTEPSGFKFLEENPEFHI